MMLEVIYANPTDNGAQRLQEQQKVMFERRLFSAGHKKAELRARLFCISITFIRRQPLQPLQGLGP